MVVRGAEGPCELEFRQMVTLRGDEDAELPRLPVTLGPGGEWLTATYDPGEVAFWSAAGELQRVIGNGPGEGPGEFGRVTDLVVDSLAGELYVFTGLPEVLVYSLSGEFLRQILLRTGGGSLWGVLLPDHTLVTTTVGSTEPKLIAIRGDSVTRVGPAQRRVFPPMLRSALDGLWSAESSWYEIDHHSMPDGHVDYRIRREVSWFPERSDGGAPTVRGPLLSSLALDPVDGLVFAVIGPLDDPDAPSQPMPRARSPEEGRELSRAYFDMLIEVFTVDGRLIASSLYDDGSDAPRPLGPSNPADVWYHVDESDPRTPIDILTPVLINGARSP